MADARRSPDVTDLLARQLRDSLAEHWTGTEADLDAEVEALVAEAREAGRKIRENRVADTSEPTR